MDIGVKTDIISKKQIENKIASSIISCKNIVEAGAREAYEYISDDVKFA